VPFPKPMDERAAIMRQWLQELQFQGYRVQIAAGPQAIVVSGSPINHTFHAVMCLVSCGLWLLIWLILLGFGGEKRHQIWVDQWGNRCGLQ
jgi:hypothetical protein